MVSLGPLPMSVAVLLVAFALAVAVGRSAARMPGHPPLPVMPPLLDMLLVGALAARLGFVLQWWPQYLDDPWAILRIGDGGFTSWIGVPVALAFGAWRARAAGPLRRPLALGVVTGLAAWAVLAGALALIQQSTLKLPATELATLDRATTRLSALSGKPMVVNLWATWCPPCRREMPVLADAQARRGDVTFAFVNQGESASAVRDYLRGGGMQLQNVLLDPSSSVMLEAGSRGLPTTLFFDAGGRLVDTHVGELSEATLTRKLQRFGPVPPLRSSPVPATEVN